MMDRLDLPSPPPPPAHPSTRGVRGAEGTFSACSFWYVEALARAWRLDEARLAFEKVLSHANHVGLYADRSAAPDSNKGTSLGR